MPSPTSRSSTSRRSDAPVSTPAARTVWQDLQATPFTWQIPDKLNIARACVDDQRADDLALIIDHGETHTRYSFGELASLSRRFAQVLHDCGIDAGERVGVMVPQGLAVVTAHLGSFRLGAVTVPLSVKFGPEAVAYRLSHSGARVLVIDADNYARIHPALADVESLQTVFVVGPHPFDTAPIHVRSFDEVYASTEFAHTAHTGPDSPAIIIYTSGTTGQPKGALHGHRILPAHMPGMRTAFMNAPQPED